MHVTNLKRALGGRSVIELKRPLDTERIFAQLDNIKPPVASQPGQID
jgi:hypothetical protein